MKVINKGAHNGILNPLDSNQKIRVFSSI